MGGIEVGDPSRHTGYDLCPLCGGTHSLLLENGAREQTITRPRDYASLSISAGKHTTPIDQPVAT